MGWRRGSAPDSPSVPRHADGRPLLAPGETEDISRAVKAALARVDDRFPVAEYNSAMQAGLVRHARISALQRSRSLPYRIGAGTAAAGVGGWGTAALAELLAGPVGHLIASAATPAGAAVALVAARMMHRNQVRAWSGLYNRASTGIVAVLGANAMLGPGSWSWLLGVALVGGGAWLASPWMRAHQMDATSVLAVEHHPAPELEPAHRGDAAEFAVRWRRDVAREGGKAAGSELSDGHPFDNGLEFGLTLAGGMTLPQLQSRVVEIASALDCDPMQLVLDDPPASTDGWRSAKRAKLRYVTRSPITSIVEYTGPRYRNGRIGLGPYADGHGMGEYVLFAEDSMYSGIIVGSTGSGKSGLINGLVSSARSSGYIVTIYLDPKVNSSPELAETATVPVLGLDRAEEFTLAVEMLLKGRRLESGLHGWPEFTPTRERPGYLIVIDECDMLFRLPGMGARWGMIAKTARALGAGLVLATQIDAVIALGNNEMLRSNVARHNVVLMRTESASSGGKLIAPELPSSRTLPGAPGYAYLKALDARRAPLRAMYLPGANKCPEGYNALVALQQNPDAPVCPIGLRAFGTFLAGTPEERREQDRARLRTELDAFLAGAPGAAPPGPQPGPLRHLIEQIPKALTGNNVIPIRRSPARVPRPATAAEGAHLSDTDRRILAAVQAGHTRTYLIVAATGLRGPQVSNAGKKLAGLGLLVDAGHGRWELPAQDREVGA